jgi:hypothetical protein
MVTRGETRCKKYIADNGKVIDIPGAPRATRTPDLQIQSLLKVTLALLLFDIVRQFLD